MGRTNLNGVAMSFYKISIIADAFSHAMNSECGAFDFYVSRQNVNRMFQPEDAMIISSLIDSMLPDCFRVEKQVGDVDYSVQILVENNSPRSELDLFL